MPLYDFQCQTDACQTIFEGYVSLADYPLNLTCPRCGGETAKYHMRRSASAPSEPVVVYQAPDGTFRFPPDVSTASTAMYDQQGFTRIELRGWSDVRRFESHMNQHELSQVRRRVERQCEQHEASESARRAEIRRCLDQGFRVPEVDERGRPTGRTTTIELSGFGRKVLQAAMDNNDRKGGPRARDSGFFVEAYSMDRSNREADPRRRGQ